MTDQKLDLRNLSAGVPERLLPDDMASTCDHPARYLFAAHWAAGRHVADLCCGTGFGTNLLAAAGAAKAYGMDISRDAIDAAKGRYSTDNIDFVCGDCTQGLPFSGLDLAICFEGIEHVHNPDSLLESMARSLRSDGVALISTPNAEAFAGGHSGNPHHVKEYTRRDFERILLGHFKHVKMYFQWGMRDPYDFDWTVANVVRALLPVPLKTWLRRSNWSTATSGSSGRHDERGTALRYRPLPVAYLSLPGLQFEVPRVWLAVGTGPRHIVD